MKTHETTQAINKTSIELVDITPDLAEVWLATSNTENRPLSRRRVEQMAHDMTAGEWRITPDLIAFNVDDVLVNGQHRLAAIAASGVTLRMWVMKNLPGDSFQVTDDVKRRTFSDYLGIMGVPQHTNVSSLVNNLLLIEHFGRPRLMRAVNNTTSDLVNFYRTLDQEEVLEAVRAGAAIAQHTGASRVGCSIGYYLTARVDLEDALAFAEEVKFGAAQGMLFRDTMLRDRLTPHPTFSLKPENVSAYYIKTWNAWRDGVEIRMLKFRAGGTKPEQFPKPF